MTDASDWTGRVGRAWAQEWRRTDRAFAALTRALLDEARIGDFACALDIGCGAGELSCALARSRPRAQVLGIDIASDLLAVARHRGEGLANLAFREGDAARWRHQGGRRPDLLISRHGAMFFADPVAAFAHLRQEATPGAQLRFSCFRARKDNIWATVPLAALGAAPEAGDPHAPGPFAFAEEAHVAAILADAGWTDAAFEPIDHTMVVGEGESEAEAVADAVSYFARIGPAARALAELPEAERPAGRERIGAALAPFQGNGQVSLPAASWIVTARVP